MDILVYGDISLLLLEILLLLTQHFSMLIILLLVVEEVAVVVVVVQVVLYHPFILLLQHQPHQGAARHDRRPFPQETLLEALMVFVAERAAVAVPPAGE
jgi:hypothetical protein